MKKYPIINCLLINLILCGCITEYEPKGIDEVADILVVGGIITDDETIITLSRSINLSDEFGYTYEQQYVYNAKVFVECDDGTQWEAKLPGFRSGRYTIKNGKLNPELKYRLRIVIDEQPGYMRGEMNPYEYLSDYSYPVKTPEIEDIFWIKRELGQPVMIHVSTQSPDNSVVYYRWSYKEDWEINSEFRVEGYPYFCWRAGTSSEILISSTERTSSGRLTYKVLDIDPWNRKLSVMYRIDVKQNAISKRAYDYFANIKKNSQQTSSIFAPIPSELRGNIICVTDMDRPVIGYVEVSLTTQNRLYIPRSTNVYERPYPCLTIPIDTLLSRNDGIIPPNYVPIDPPLNESYTFIYCVDCTFHGTTQKPEDWTW